MVRAEVSIKILLSSSPPPCVLHVTRILLVGGLSVCGSLPAWWWPHITREDFIQFLMRGRLSQPCWWPAKCWISVTLLARGCSISRSDWLSIRWHRQCKYWQVRDLSVWVVAGPGTEISEIIWAAVQDCAGPAALGARPTLVTGLWRVRSRYHHHHPLIVTR